MSVKTAQIQKLLYLVDILPITAANLNSLFGIVQGVVNYFGV